MTRAPLPFRIDINVPYQIHLQRRLGQAHSNLYFDSINKHACFSKVAETNNIESIYLRHNLKAYFLTLMRI